MVAALLGLESVRALTHSIPFARLVVPTRLSILVRVSCNAEMDCEFFFTAFIIGLVVE